MDETEEEAIAITGSRCAVSSQRSTNASIQIVGGRIARILDSSGSGRAAQPIRSEIDLTGFLVMPGFINAHDHLEFALFPRLADPPYRNYVDWGKDIHSKFPDVIAQHRAVPKDLRLWWGGLRNLLCGVTTVSHHNPLWPELQRSDFPVRVVREYGWAHSLALGGDLHKMRAATPKGRAFIVHACEGVDELAREELWTLDESGLLDADTVLVHGLAIDCRGVALMNERHASLIVCPSSNYFLFGKLPDMLLLSQIGRVALGSDSPLTAEGDLLDEIRFAIRNCKIPPRVAYDMVTTLPAKLLRVENAEGSLKESGAADLIAIRDTGEHPADRLRDLSMDDIEFVMMGGRVQLASQAVLERLAASEQEGLEPLMVGEVVRWLRAPVRNLLRRTEEVLGENEVRLGNRAARVPACVEAANAC
jgi:cytosine/adenosine deaminase-related metal-dependent hydrolase